MYLELKPEAAPVPRGAPASPRQKARGKTPRKLVVVEGDALRGKSFGLDSELMIGRADKCHIKIDDAYVSQVHARVYPRGETFMVEDQGSTNGTYVNRRRITSPVELRKGDQIKIGKTVLEARR